MEIVDAARALGMKPREVREVRATDAGHVVTTHDGTVTLVREDGSMAHRYVEVPQAVEAPVVEDDGDDLPPAGPDADPVPDGSITDVMAWVDGDQDRAERALDAELHREPQRATLVSQLSALLAKLGAQS
jgi:hypothetical protein